MVHVSIDGFRPEHRDGAFAPRTAARFYEAMGVLARLFRVEVEGLENIPSGRALLVANHAFGLDVAFATARIWSDLHRTVWSLGEHKWWTVPFVRRLAAAVGTVDGTPENADRLLAQGELVLVLPGGLREAVKPRELRYRLLWGNRYGFVRAAIRNRAPIVPLACIGADDLFDLVGNAFRRGERLLRRTGWPLPVTARVLPIPHLVPLRYIFGEPIEPVCERDDERAARKLRHEVEGAVHELIESELARRAGIDLE